MSIKDAALRYATAVENELIQIRADQMEQGQELTDRINRVANDVKALDDKVTALTGELSGLKNTQTQMLEILIDIQRRMG